MKFIEEPDFKTKIILERFLEESRNITKKEVKYLENLVRDYQELNEARFLEDGKYLMIRRFKAELILVKNRESKTLKVLPLGNVRLQYQSEMFIRLSSGGKGLNESKSKTAKNHFHQVKEMLASKTIIERALDKAVSDLQNK